MSSIPFRARGSPFHERPVPVGSIVLLAAGLAAVGVSPGLPEGLALAAGLATLAGWAGSLLRAPLLIRAAFIAPFATVAVQTMEAGQPLWHLIAPVVATSLVSASLDRRADADVSSVSFVFVLVTIGGVWLTVPETEFYFPFLLGTAPLVLLAWPIQLVSLGPGSAGVLTVMAALAVHGGTFRDGAIVATTASPALLFVLRWLVPTLREAGRHWTRSAYGLVIAQVAACFWVTRIAGLRESRGAAIALLVPLAVAVLALLVLPRRGASNPHPSTEPTR